VTPAEFVAQVQTYYGSKYPEPDRPVLVKWLKRFEADGGDFQGLFDQVTLDVSKNFGKLPDKALLNESARKINPNAGNPLALPPPRSPNDDLADEQAMYEFELQMKALAARFSTTGSRHIPVLARVATPTVDSNPVTGPAPSPGGAPSQQNESSEDA
jgi:hypothetical protein